MRWWDALRQAYPNRSRVALGIAVLLFCFVVGGILVGGATAAIHLSSTESFFFMRVHSRTAMAWRAFSYFSGVSI